MRTKLPVLGLIFIAIPLCGTTGKIVGIVTDMETGTPLAHVNIEVLGTPLGTATDEDGHFVIINVPPGTYSLRISRIGYQPVVLKDVIVKIGLTTEINVTLKPTAIPMGEIVIKAKRPLVEKDVTSARSIVTSEELERLPIESLHDVISRTAGVTRGIWGEIHVRGGRSDEVIYMVDGIPITNPYTRALDAYLPPSVIRQMELVSGTFNAEYGQAMSGVINIVTKEGAPQLEGRLYLVRGDYLSTHTHIFRNIDRFELHRIDNLRYINSDDLYKIKGISDFELNLSTPLFRLNKLRLFLAIKHYQNEGHIYGVRRYLTSDVNGPIMNWDEDTTGHGDNAYVPMNPYAVFSYDGKLTWFVSPKLKISYSHLQSYRKRKVYLFTYTYVPDGTPYGYTWTTQDILTVQHTIGAKTFYNLGVFYSYNRYDQYVYEDPCDPRYYFDDRYYSGVRFKRGGCYQSWTRRYSNTYGIKFDITSQLHPEHLVKMGFIYQTYELFYHWHWIDPTAEDPFHPPHPMNWDEYKRYPHEWAVYVQDKIETRDLIVNVGVRFDYFDPRAKDIPAPESVRVIVDPFNPPPMPQLVQVEPKYQISPRLGVAFPISERGVFHFAYGHFFQMPRVGYLYTNPDFEIRPQYSRQIVGNPDLKPQHTIAYEVGFRQGIGEALSIDVTAYYKDIRNLLTTKKVSANPPVNTDIYFRYVNEDYGDVKGVTVSIERRIMRYWGARIEYTFQVAEANNTSPTTVYASQSGNVIIERPKKVVPVSWDERHTLNASLTLGKPGSWIVSFTASYGSGKPYTPVDKGGKRIGDEYSARKPSTFNIDMKASWDVKFRGIVVSFVLKVYNLLDRLNEYMVWDDTGRAGYTHLYERYGYVDPGYTLRPYYYSAPRQVRLGVEVRF
ncbi:TonB-dependent receptor [candidate division WOR-3 bacterium]|nr:TonB-dependent receptor [candidate division WOR-3 bacterium]